MAEELVNSKLSVVQRISKALHAASLYDDFFLRMKDFFIADPFIYIAIVSPLLTLISVCVTVTLAFGFIRGNILGPAQRLLILIAVLDSCTVLFPTLSNLVFLSMDKARGIIEYSICHIFLLLNIHVPSALQSFSSWVKALLVFQRHYANVKPFEARHFFTTKKYVVFFSLAGFFSVGIELALTEIYDLKKRIWAQDIDVHPDLQIINGCLIFNTENANLLFQNISTLVRATLFGIIPTVTLLYLDIKLFMNLRKQEVIRKTLTTSDNTPPLLNVQRVITCIGISLFLQEMFKNVVLIAFAVRVITFDELSEKQFDILESVSHIVHLTCIIIIRPFDLIVYSAASKKFREALKSPFKCLK